MSGSGSARCKPRERWCQAGGSAPAPGLVMTHVRVALFDSRIRICGRPSRRSCAITHELLRTRAEIVEAPQLAAALILRSMRAQARLRLEGWPHTSSMRTTSSMRRRKQKRNAAADSSLDASVWERPPADFRVAPQGASPTALQYVINVIYAARSSMQRRRAAAHTLAPWSTP